MMMHEVIIHHRYKYFSSYIRQEFSVPPIDNAATMAKNSAPQTIKKKEHKSLEELLEKKRALCDGANKKHERELDDHGTASNEDDDKVDWDAHVLSDVGSIRDTSQTTLLDAVVKKKKEQEQRGFWGKLIQSVSEFDGDWTSTDVSSTSLSSMSTTCSSNDCSLLTKEMMFNIKEEKRMMEERERVKKSQDLARKILDDEQKIRAKEHVKQMKSAVKWGLFTMVATTIDR